MATVTELGDLCASNGTKAETQPRAKSAIRAVREGKAELIAVARGEGVPVGA